MCILSTSPSGQPAKCPQCRYQPDHKHVRNICRDAGKIRTIPKDDLFKEDRPYIWLYEGRNNGWWYYDYELQDVLERAWDDGHSSIEWYICGQKVNIDFTSMKQINKVNNAVREIRRMAKGDLDQLLIKGVGGMMPKAPVLPQ
jgi:hypothetical protein